MASPEFKTVVHSELLAVMKRDVTSLYYTVCKKKIIIIHGNTIADMQSSFK